MTAYCHHRAITLLSGRLPDLRVSQHLQTGARSRVLVLVASSPVGFLSGASEASFPLWLKSLMTVCCCVTDCYLQNVAISTLLEVINHSQSLALVIEDKMKRYKSSGYNPFSGRLQMVTAPPVAPGILKVVAERTDFYQVFPTWRRVGGALRPSSQSSY